MESISKSLLIPFRSSGIGAITTPRPELYVTVQQIQDLVLTVIRKQAVASDVKQTEGEVRIVTGWDAHPLTLEFSRQHNPFILNSIVPVVIDIVGEYNSEAMLKAFQKRWPEANLPSAYNLADLDLSSYLLLGLSKIIFSACIARPGTFGTYLSEEEKLSFEVSDECLNVAREYGWPPISNLNVEQVYRWLTKIDGFKDGFGYGPLGRALAAFSYAASPTYQTETGLIWPLIGLEALSGSFHSRFRQRV